MPRDGFSFRGVGVALVTLFSHDGSLDAPATARLAHELADLGVRAIVVAGSTGEAASLDRAERRILLETVKRSLEDRRDVLIIAGTGAPSARQAALLTADALEAGADAVMALSPPASADLVGYYETVRKAAGEVPVLAYHFPLVSAPGIPLESLAALPVDGCKDSSRDPVRLLLTLADWDRPIYVGAASMLSLAGPIGAAGAILALSNCAPELCAAAFAGDPEAQLALAPYERRLATLGFPTGVKHLTAERFNTATTSRL